MKIVEINTVNGTGSTGKIAVALYRLAKAEGHTPYIAYGRGRSPADINGYKIGNVFDFAVHVLSNFFLGNSGFASKATTKRFLTWLDSIQPDILHLHNLHGFYLHVGMLFDYIKARNIPVVWTLHDCWPFTGQCAHFDYADCTNWTSACHDCPIYRTDYPYSLFKDNSKNNFTDKKKYFTGVSKLTLVTPSYWLAELIKESFLQEYSVKIISNGIDLNLFSPKTILSEVCDNRKILLGVANVWTKKKGIDFFLQLADMLDDSFRIVLIGVNKRQQRILHKAHPHKITAITRTSNQKELAGWYTAAYAFINPTLEDNFPTTNLEALACGTPVITFDTGGSPESITNTCGIVVEKGNINALREAVISLAGNPKITAESCRKQALKYNKDTLFKEYLHLYQQICSVEP